MRLLAITVCGLLSISTAEAANAPPQFSSLSSTVDWINNYRATRPVALAPLAVRALSFHGAFKDPDGAGIYIGFIAGLIGTYPDKASIMIRQMLPLREEDQWVLVRGIAYSGHPRWKQLLREFAPEFPNRAVMIARYQEGKLPVLADLTIKPSPTTFERMRDAFKVHWFDGAATHKAPKLEPSQTSVDTLWGYYLASGSYAPIMRMVELLPWSNDKDDADRLTVGSMAKYTLAVNASRDPDLLAVLKYIRVGNGQPKPTAAVLGEVIEAAETAETGRLRKDALASIEQLKTKGPAYKREMSTWGKVGQGALAVGCVAAAATGHVELGLPCVIGGGATNAAAYYINER